MKDSCRAQNSSVGNSLDLSQRPPDHSVLFIKEKVDGSANVQLINGQTPPAPIPPSNFSSNNTVSAGSCLQLNSIYRIGFENLMDQIDISNKWDYVNQMTDAYVRFITARPKTIVAPRSIGNLRSIDYEDEARCNTKSLTLLMISLTQLIFYYVDQYVLIFNLSEALLYLPSKPHQIWRYLTCMLVHENEYHLYFNIVLQLLVGIPLETVHTWRVPLLYVAGIIGGTLFQAVIYPTEGLYGASAGVFAFYTGHIANVILNWNQMTKPLPIVHLIIFGILAVFDGVYPYILCKNMGTVSYVAHLGGAVVGLLVGVQILKNFIKTDWEHKLKLICMVLYFSLMGSFIITIIIMNRS